MDQAFYNENEPYAAKWLENLMEAGHVAAGKVDARSIIELKPDDLAGFVQAHFFAGIGIWSYALRSAGWPDELPIWSGSCPCTPFSVAGRRKGFADERHLWPVWFELIRVCNPPALIGEQVSSPDGLAWFDTVSADLESAGYAVGAIDSCAAGVGAPHVRQRLYWVAITRDERRKGLGLHLREWQERSNLSQARGRGQANLAAPANGKLGNSGCAGGRRDSRAVPGAQRARQAERQAARRVADLSVPAGATRGVALGDASRQGLARRKGQRSYDETQREAAQRAGDNARGPVNGFWANAEWIPCRDGKARPVEPGLECLAPGNSSTVGRLRAYGNALCAPQAEAFCRAVIQTLVQE